jgi:hypothetical protein
MRKFLRKKNNKVGKNKFYNEQKQVKNCVLCIVYGPSTGLICVSGKQKR